MHLFVVRGACRLDARAGAEQTHEPFVVRPAAKGHALAIPGGVHGEQLELGTASPDGDVRDAHTVQHTPQLHLAVESAGEHGVARRRESDATHSCCAAERAQRAAVLEVEDLRNI